MAEIVTATIDTIATNPYRRLHAYPYIQSKLDALQRSIDEVGLWPSIIARPLADRLWKYEMAFGHHRIEAARRSGLKEVPIIVDCLTDKQMLQYMGRENLEDYNANFLIQLESWEAAIKSGFLISKKIGDPQPIEVARLLGWTRIHADGSHNIMNATAAACHAAYALIVGGYNAREEFVDQTVASARDIAERAWARIEQIDKQARGGNYSRDAISKAKRQVGRGAAETLKQFRKGSVNSRDLRNRVDFNVMGRTRADDKPSPLFAVYANTVADNLKKTLQTDADAEKLAEIVKVLPQLSLLEDWEALRRLDVELINLGKRAEGWQKRLIPSKEKVVELTRLEGGRA